MPKRRTKGDGGLYRRPDGLWIGTVELGWGADGKRKRKRVSSKTQAECLRKMREVRASVELGVLPTSTTVTQWLDHWEKSPSFTRLRKTTRRGYTSTIRCYLKPHLGHIRLDRLQPSDIERMLTAMADEGLGLGTRRQARAVLQSSLKMALREQRVTRNVAALAHPPSGRQAPHEYLPLAEARKVVAKLTEHGQAGDWRTASRFLAALLAGLRQGEALGLLWDHVHLDDPEPWLDIQQAAQHITGEGMVVGDVKSATSHRELPMVAPLVTAMRAWKADSGGVGFVWGGAEPADARADWQEWKDLLEAAGVAHIPLHGARSTTASLLFAAGVSDLMVARILGHSQVHVTRAHYLRTDGSQYAAALTTGLAALLAPEGEASTTVGA